MPVVTIVHGLLQKLGNIHLINTELCINFHETNSNSRLLSPKLGGGVLLGIKLNSKLL